MGDEDEESESSVMRWVGVEGRGEGAREEAMEEVVDGVRRGKRTFVVRGLRCTKRGLFVGMGGLA